MIAKNYKEEIDLNQNMKRGIAFIMALLLFCLPVFAADEALEANNLVIEKSCALNKTLTFEKNDFTELFGKDGKNVKGIIITTLPQSDAGKLLLSGGDISLYDTIPLSEVNKLEFEPNISSEVKAVSFDFKAYSSKDFIDGEPAVSISLNDPSAVLPEPKNFSLTAIKDIAVNGFFKTQEPAFMVMFDLSSLRRQDTVRLH
ncbi:hypothetical protein SDC9_114105 [bioreactor metagenome]|uniref:Uncharacterized protein n=1 Tax=bioreactor metagenome TaxID=1076179 RepID=A0A645BPY7_9ZZZZ